MPHGETSGIRSRDRSAPTVLPADQSADAASSTCSFCSNGCLRESWRSSPEPARSTPRGRWRLADVRHAEDIQMTHLSPEQSTVQIKGYHVTAKTGESAGSATYRACRDADGLEVAMKVLHIDYTRITDITRFKH